MTPSEPLASTATAAAPAAPLVLLTGHLHPAVLLLRLLDGVQRSALPVVLGVLVERWFLILGGVLFLLQVGSGLVRYLTFQYTLTAGELITREGILHRQERRIPIDRVQDLGFESTILRRLLGLVVVLVETAAGKGAEATLDSLSRGDAEQLRQVLLAARQKSAATGAPVLAAEPEWLVFAARTGDLLLRGITDLRVSAIVVSAFAAMELADQFGLVARMRGAADSFYRWLSGFSPMVVAGLLTVLMLVVLGAGVVASALGNVMVFHGFRLTLRGDTLQRRFGLLTTRQKTLPRRRVQRVSVEQTWLRRLLGVAVVHADSAGGSRNTGDEAQGGFDVVVPLASLPVVQALLPALLPELPLAVPPLRPAARQMIARIFLKGVLAAVAAIAVAWPLLGAPALAALLLLPLAWLVGRLQWGNLGHALGERHLYLRLGVLGRYQACVPTAKVQAVVQRQSPLQQVLGLCDLTVFVAGGSPTRLPDLTPGDAAMLQRELADRSAAAAAGEWRGKAV